MKWLRRRPSEETGTEKGYPEKCESACDAERVFRVTLAGPIVDKSPREKATPGAVPGKLLSG